MTTQTIGSDHFKVKPCERTGYLSPMHAEDDAAPLPPKRVRDRIIREALKYFEGHAIDFTQYEAGISMTDSEGLCDVVFVHRESEAVIRLQAVWFDKRGKILQGGQCYGELHM